MQTRLDDTRRVRRRATPPDPRVSRSARRHGIVAPPSQNEAP